MNKEEHTKVIDSLQVIYKTINQIRGNEIGNSSGERLFRQNSYQIINVELGKLFDLLNIKKGT